MRTFDQVCGDTLEFFHLVCSSVVMYSRFSYTSESQSHVIIRFNASSHLIFFFFFFWIIKTVPLFWRLYTRKCVFQHCPVSSSCVSSATVYRADSSRGDTMENTHTHTQHRCCCGSIKAHKLRRRPTTSCLNLQHLNNGRHHLTDLLQVRLQDTGQDFNGSVWILYFLSFFLSF